MVLCIYLQEIKEKNKRKEEKAMLHRILPRLLFFVLIHEVGKFIVI